MCCENCGGQTVRHEEKDRVKQVIELPEKLFNVIEYRGMAYRCPSCGKIHVCAFPQEIEKQGVLGASMVSALVSLRFEANASITGIQGVLKDVFKLNVSRGCICENINKGSKCLEPARKAIQEDMPNNDYVHGDETSFKENGKRIFAWLLASKSTALFKLGNRSGDTLEEVMGDRFHGIISCDCYPVYGSFSKSHGGVRLQFCFAHFGRDCKRCTDHIGQAEIFQYGEKMKGYMNKVFEARDKYLDAPTEENLALLRSAAKEFDAAGADAPDKGFAATLSKRFKGGKSNYTTFLENPLLIDLTNNRAERIIRKIVWFRVITQGIRGEVGRLANERYWSVKATCEIQNRSFFDFFRDSYNAVLKGLQPPSILPN